MGEELGEEAAAEIKDLSDVIPRAIEVEGEQRTAEELAGKEIVIEGFGLRPSKFKKGTEYATVQIVEDNGAKAWFNTSSGPILETLGQIQDKLPVRCKIERCKSADGFRYFTLTGTK